MSTDHADAVDSDHDAGWHDPHDIVPDAFRERYSHAESVSEALAIAENEASDTDPDEFERCPSCLSVRLRTKPSGKDIPNKVDGDMKCTGCGEHFDNPLPSLVEARRDADHAPDTDRETERQRCRECLSTDLYPVPDRAPAVAVNWVCLDCGSRFDDALPSYNATVRGEASSAERKRIGELLRRGRSR